MPELPEVETTRRGIAPHVTGRRVVRIDVYDSRLRWPVPSDLDARMRGRTIERVYRRSKYLLMLWIASSKKGSPAAGCAWSRAFRSGVRRRLPVSNDARAPRGDQARFHCPRCHRA